MSQPQFVTVDGRKVPLMTSAKQPAKECCCGGCLDPSEHPIITLAVSGIVECEGFSMDLGGLFLLEYISTDEDGTKWGVSGGGWGYEDSSGHFDLVAICLNGAWSITIRGVSDDGPSLYPAVFGGLGGFGVPVDNSFEGCAVDPTDPTLGYSGTVTLDFYVP